MILLALATAAFDITYVAPRANEMTLVEAVERASVACGVEK